MVGAPIPDNEEQRLAALLAQQILDTAPDPRFDSFVHLAADLFNVPVALISVIDRDRQWFKSSVGIPFRETPREYSFCAHALPRPDEVMVIEDARADPRFTDNPLVRGPARARFYAGAPYRVSTGETLGTLCIIDTKPRAFTDVERERLMTLAKGVGAMVDLHRSMVTLQRASTHDLLTGLGNRVLLDAKLEMAVQDALAGRPCAVLIADIDGLRAINERLGEPAGDEVVAEVARRIALAVRGGDFVCRIGGDKFGVLLTGPIDAGATDVVARRIVERVARPPPIGAGKVAASVSVGSALSPLDGLDARGLSQAANAALNEAKRAGGGRVVAASERPLGTAGEDIHSSRVLLDDLRRALTNSEMSLHWQPYVRTDTGQVHGFEALLRWSHPIQGAIAPTLFLPLAEASGVIAEVDRRVLREACQAGASWPARYNVSVNLSSHWFNDGEVVDHVTRALRESGLAPGRLVIEITERTVITSRDVACAQMERLRAMGVRLALDDFGIGYSSLSYLRYFPFDKIKLDRAFVAAIGEEARADAVAVAIIRLGHALGMEVCGEGVETAAQFEFLRREGCELAQGYLLGRPSAVPRVDPMPIAVARPIRPRAAASRALGSALRHGDGG